MTAFQQSTVSALLLLVASACTSYYEVPIETPLQPKLEVSRFQRILVAGFLAGGSNDVDANLETARLLKSQLRNESSLDVVDAEVLDLIAIAEIEGDIVTDNTDGLGRSAQQTNNQPGDPEEEEVRRSQPTSHGNHRRNTPPSGINTLKRVWKTTRWS